ncbi:23S rRNA (adenine(2503)-C(2))-methyltransferase RlmN [Spirochaeta cellobiosiphila]|uniref:23S rRNA (adenine(2503)-C(2))-methyltransferase RlmN n=1 Tax=Spirochaeta cellobiosiphila TaxID=504483 RepID=UPI0003F62294|nr:23S rRNA (adenine(2503)-C(2))-methyltransferase RlmN [Spirochaeta cellobiosiphila]
MEKEARKFITTLSDGHQIESVILPMKSYNTLCVSSQVGCQRGCTFCSTAKMGFVRNLTVQEIINQLIMAQETYHVSIRNVVFMGMGEPMDNFDALVKAIQLFSDPHGFNIPKGRITISTSGVIPGIMALGKLAQEGDLFHRIRLAISLNASNDGIRQKLMPINRIYPLKELKKALMEYPLRKTRDKILLEYVIIPGVNDRIENIQELKEFVGNMPILLNFIPHNPKCTYEEGHRFFKWAQEAKLPCRIRDSRGRKVGGGCGQLIRPVRSNHVEYTRER